MPTQDEKEKRKIGRLKSVKKFEGLRGAHDALDSANQMEADLGFPSQETPESEAGAASFLESFFPGLSEKLAGATPEERRDAARSALKAQVESDPDSLLHKFGFDKIKETFRHIADQFAGFGQDVAGAGEMPQVQPDAQPGQMPTTLGNSARALANRDLPPELMNE